MTIHHPFTAGGKRFLQIFLQILFALLVLGSSLSPAAGRQLQMKPAVENGALTLTFSSEDSQTLDYKITTVDAPPRLVIDFADATYNPQNPDPRPLMLQHTGFSGLRWHNRENNSCRVVLDTEYASLPQYQDTEQDGVLILTLKKALPNTPKIISDSAPEQIKPQKRPFKPNNNPISIDFKGTDIQNVFRFLAEINHLNVVMSDDVSGTVTLRLKQVPWRQVMDIVLKTHQLGMEREGNVVRIAPITVFEREEAARQERLRRQAESSKVQEDIQDTVLKILKVNFANIDEVADKIESTILSDRGTIETDSRTNSLIINDIPDRIEQAQALLEELDEPVHQVMIEAKIIKIYKNSAKALGVQWGGIVTGRDNDRYYGITGNTSERNNFGIPTIEGDSNFAVNLPAAVASSGLGLIFGKIDKYALSLKLSAMQQSGEVKILSNPKVLALNQQKAEIRQGKQVPYQTSSGDTGPTTEFKNADLSLEVTPAITNNGMITMNVTVTKNSVGQETRDAGPMINTQKIETSLLLKDGETAVIGGILETNQTKSNDTVPVFGKIPLLGFLFNHNSSRGDQTELMIFITPKLIK